MSEDAAPPPLQLPKRGVRSVWAHLVLAGLSAVMLGLTYPPVGWSPLAYVALIPVTVLTARSTNGRRLTWTCFLVLLGWWLVMVSWLIPVTTGGYVALAIIQAGYQTLALVLIRFLHRVGRVAMTLALPLVWVSVELLRANFPAGGFGWFMLGHSQAAYSPEQSPGRIVQVADLLGEHGVSLVVLLTTGLIVDLMIHPLMRRGGDGRSRLSRTIRAAGLLWILVFVGAWFYGRYRIQQFDAVTEPSLRIALIQTNVPQDNKNRRTPERETVDWRAMLSLSRDAAEAEPKPVLLVWPETMSPVPVNPEARSVFAGHEGDFRGPNTYHHEIQNLTRELGVNLLVGASASNDWNESSGRLDRRSNAVHLYNDNGEQAPQRYDKIHLVPFGEYLPWIDTIPALKRLFLKYVSPYDFDYSLTAGRKLTVFDVSDREGPSVRIATPICYEDVTPGIVRRMVYAPDGAKRIDVLVNLTNSAWYPGIAQRPQHLQIATLRSIENRVPTARSVNTGISGFIDSVGRVGPVVEAAGRSQAVVGWAAAEVRTDSRTSLYGRVGRVPVVILTVLTGVWLLGGLFRRGKIQSMQSS